MEAANVVLVPGLALALGFPDRLIETLAISLAMAVAAGFLIVGAAYWRGVDRHLRFADRGSIDRALNLADRAERPLLLVGCGAIAATLAALLSRGWSPAVVAGSLLTVLAALEYINYYHRQLQHFDNKADFARLFSGKRLKAAHMARDLANWRKRQASGNHSAQ